MFNKINSKNNIYKDDKCPKELCQFVALTMTSFMQLKSAALLKSLTYSWHILYGSELSNAVVHTASAFSRVVETFNCTSRRFLIFKK